jgi:5-methylcytosine-specific restriction protein A
MRYEFPKPVKRLAVKRAEGRCEAVGEVYGLAPGQRCYGDLGRGLEIDHYPIPATDAGSNVLDNAVVCCTTCHGFKTRTYDIPMQAKGKRVSDKHLGIRKPSRLQSRGFAPAKPQNTATSPLRAKIEAIE